MNEISLEGVTDLHIHAAPDIRPRLMDDIELAREAAQAGMRGVLFKSHHTLTADRAALAEKHVTGVRVFGGVVLNYAVGGLNPAAIETALAFGAREIWMPTLDAANHRRAKGMGGGGISILDEAATLLPEVLQILRLIAEQDVILGTGHLSVGEIKPLVKAAREAGVERILITHPELPLVSMPISVQQELAGPGVFFERCLIVTTPGEGDLPLSTIAQAVREIGPESTVMATDFGQAENPSPVAGMRRYIADMMDFGFDQAQLDRMTRVNPASLLGI
jgi:sugar phosphate isomerase/epimerase